MSLRLKFILILTFEVALTVALAGFLIFRQSKNAVIELASDLLVANTERAFVLCESYISNGQAPSSTLIRDIGNITIAKDGYIAILNSSDGELLLHPTDEGRPLYNRGFPHIQSVIDNVRRSNRRNGYTGFIRYRQATQARGRQGAAKIGYYKYVEAWDWIILATGYERDVYSSRHELRKAVTPVILAIMLLGGILVYITVGRLLAPIRLLTESTRAVSDGNWEVEIEYHSEDEVGLLAKSFNTMVQSLNDNARVLHEFDVAKNMQAEMLPRKYPLISGASIDAISIPATEIGGDFYDFLDLDEGRFGLVVGDVSGHGVSAAMVMTAAMSTIRYAATTDRPTNEVLIRVNSRLKKDIKRDMFVALFYAIYDAGTGRLCYTNAGLTMPYIVRNGTVQLLPRTSSTVRFPLGAVDSPNYEQLSVDLHSGDTLVIYTDGVVEAMDGERNEFGFERLADAIRRNAAGDPGEMIARLVRDVTAHSLNQLRDDVTLVVMKMDTAASPVLEREAIPVAAL